MERFAKNSYLAHFSIKAQKNEKIQPKIVSYNPEKWNFLTLILKNFVYFRKGKSRKKILIFSQKKAFLIFQKTEAPKKFLICSQKKAFLIFGETETPKKFFIFQKKETPKKILYFRKKLSELHK